MKKVTALNLDEDLLKALDDYLDGRVSRSAAVNLIVWKFLDNPSELL